VFGEKKGSTGGRVTSVAVSKGGETFKEGVGRTTRATFKLIQGMGPKDEKILPAGENTVAYLGGCFFYHIHGRKRVNREGYQSSVENPRVGGEKNGNA